MWMSRACTPTRAAGISSADQQDKISILVAPFYEEQDTQVIPTPANVPQWVLYAAIGGGALFLVLMLLMLLIHRIRAKKRGSVAQAAAPVSMPQPVEAAVPQQADILEMQTEKSMELRQDVRKFAEENPEIAAQMVKNWLREGERTT